jgi:high-affinity iron transporter
VFANYLIGLREGLEASLVVCILIAYLVKTDRRDALKPIWIGIGVAVTLALGFGCALEFGSQELTFEAQEALGGSLSIVAVGLVTWMVFWMRRTARHLKADLHGKLDAALQMGTGALVATAFLAVGREGLETALFVWASVRASSDGTEGPADRRAAGHRDSSRARLPLLPGRPAHQPAKFFTWTGGMLVVVAAGVLAYGFHDLQEADFLPGLNNKAFDISETIPPDSWYGTLLKGVFNFQPDPTVLQVVVWALYLVPTLALVPRPGRVRVREAGRAGTEGLKPADEQVEQGAQPSDASNASDSAVGFPSGRGRSSDVSDSSDVSKSS